jgi:transcriptional regulator with XRE-family HTH domain
MKNKQNINANAILDRVKLLRKRYAGSRGKSKFARELGISASTYNYYETDRVPPIDVLLKICELTGVDLDWLLSGGSSRPKPAFGANRAVLEQLDELLTKSPELTEAVTAFIELLCEKKGVEKGFRPAVRPTKARRPGWIPVLGRTAAGIIHCWGDELLPQPKRAVTQLDALVKKHVGRKIIASDEGAVSVDLRSLGALDGVNEAEANLIRVSGTGRGEVVEFVECEQSVPAAQGHIAVARVADQIGVTCKLMRSTGDSVHLIPINERYETKVVPKDELLWALAVLCHVRV